MPSFMRDLECPSIFGMAGGIDEEFCAGEEDGDA